jgi:superfamily II DNA or RNA helicase
MTLRPYQQACIEASLAGFEQYRKQVAVLPTGGGKAILMAKMAEAILPNRTLMLCHREELVLQAADKFNRATGMYAAIEKAEQYASLSALVVVASIQTLQRARLERWPKDHFSLVIPDEAHHATSVSWQNVLKHFDGHAKVWGCTATPNRKGKQNLGKYFENVAYEISLIDLIRDGFLCPIRVKALPLKIDIAAVRQTSGDYNAEDLDRAIHPYLEEAARCIAEHAFFRKTIVFVPLIQTSKDFVAAARRVGLNAEHIDGTSEDRKEILGRFAGGEIDLLCNSCLLLEGYDEPSIDCVVMLRPTRSHTLYCQAIGRGTRIAPAKRNLLILDPLFLHEKHDLIKPAHLIAHKDEEAEAMTQIVEAGAEQAEFDLEELQRSAIEAREKKLREEIEKKAKRNARTVDPVEFCLSLHALETAEYEPVVEWEGKELTDKQRIALRQQGIDPNSIKYRGQANRILELIYSRRKLKLASPKQLAWLRRLGHPAPETCSFEEASKYLDGRFGKAEREAA